MIKQRKTMIWAVAIGTIAVGSHVLNAKTSQSLRNLRNLFSHKTHLPIFEQQQIKCTHCHTLNISTHKESESKAAAFSENLLFEVARGSCHLCHNNPKAQVSAPNRCNLCHLLDPAIKPIDHTLDWITWHGSQAKIREQDCTQCHQSHDCQQCHSPSPAGLPQRRVHPGNFEDFHSIQARINAKDCSTCHSPNYCLRCHQRGQ